MDRLGSLVIQIAAGEYFSLALLDGGTIHAWGGAGHDELVINDIDVAGFKAIAAGGHHGLAIDVNDRLVAWGGTNYSSTSQGVVPSQYEDVEVVAIGAGHRTSYAILDTGELIGWGDVDPQDIPDLLYPQYGEAWVAVSGGYNHAIALSNFGLAYVWGESLNATMPQVPSSVQGYITKIGTGSSAMNHNYVIYNVTSSP